MRCTEGQQPARASAIVPSPTRRLVGAPLDTLALLPASYPDSTDADHLHVALAACTPHDPPEALYLLDCNFRL